MDPAMDIPCTNPYFEELEFANGLTWVSGEQFDNGTGETPSGIGVGILKLLIVCACNDDEYESDSSGGGGSAVNEERWNKSESWPGGKLAG